MYINDLDCGIVSKISIFADNTKLDGKILTRDDCDAIQRDLDNLSAWSDKWLLKFNEAKCKVMHIGYNNTKYNFELYRQNFIKGAGGKDVGLIPRNDLKCATQCLAVSRKANAILGFITRNFDCKTLNVTNNWPQLEYGVQFWSSCIQEDIKILESIERQANTRNS